MERRGDKSKGNLLFVIMFVILILAVLVIGILHFIDEKKKERAQQQYEQLMAEAVRQSDQKINDAYQVSKDTKENLDASDPLIEKQQTSDEDMTHTFSVMPNDKMDFNVLWEQNPDVVAWIEIPGTVVNYPVLRSEDNEYYLLHNLDGSKGYPGCIYMESYNSEGFEDPLTILYGHNMKNGTMFGSLKKFQKEEFFEANQSLYIYLPDKRFQYELLAISQYTDEHLLQQDFVSNQEGGYTFKGMQGDEGLIFYEKMTNYEDSKALFADKQKLTETDQFLVLSTCLGNPNKRLLVVYKRV